MASTSSLPALSPAGNINRPSDSTGTPSTSGTTPITHKEWVIPPRPKPGRKPATDTPPTKRKAQNRAAQRAFRERRAAKVEEMEEQMREKECVLEKERNDLLQHINQLESNVERFKGEVLAWQQRCAMLEREILQERQMREEISRREKGNHQMQTSILNTEESQIDDTTMMSCGNCTLDTRCECLEQVLKNPGDDVSQNSKIDGISMSNEQTTSTSMQEQMSNVESNDLTSLETDFTSRFNTGTSKNTETIATEVPENPSNDRCGFCQDGAPCLCAQMDQSNPSQDTTTHLNPRSSSISRFTPPPAAGDVCRSSIPLPRSSQRNNNTNNNNPCANGPGTCGQCQLDPSSTLFCKSLATTIPRSTNNNPNITTNNASPNNPSTSVTESNNRRREEEEQKKESSGIYLSCADTYTTLSRHPRFQDAADEMESWLGKLKTTLPVAEEGRPAMEIEAASVMGVLKFFDRRFGRD
ncbi:MAG: hypothetical protein M1823_003039 [Watsoniomyces obsoletus]|nr:MAG: hypothetical protein M1823_003039 [Watsoniomyces obsoletus]